jgi:SEC-C motif
MRNINKNGLSRDIPDPVKREVRKRCGFGCVVCGCAIYQYEHVDPTFAEAFTHDPDSITLLCAGCHDRVTRGLLSKETVKKHDHSPQTKKAGFSFGPFDIGDNHPEVVAGAFRAKMTSRIIVVSGEPILAVEPPEEVGGPFRLSALLCDSAGTEILRIVSNEWQASTNNWDIEVIGQQIKIRSAHRNVTLSLRTLPPHTIIIEKLDMYYQGTHIVCDGENYFKVITPSGRTFHASATEVTECECGISVSPSGLVIGIGCKSTSMSAQTYFSPPPVPRTSEGLKPGRNERCRCGSGLKYKKCHGK